MQVFDINIKPNMPRTIDVRATYIYFLSGSAGGADSTIAFQPDAGGETLYLRPGQAYKIPASDRIGTRWTMSNLKGEAAITGQVLMGEGEFIDNRITGSVEVIDGGKARTMAGVSYLANQFALAAAGEYPHIQLLNQSSTKRLIVKQIMLSSAVAQQFLLTTWNAALTVAGNAPVNKMQGGPASAGQVFTQSSGVLIGAAGGMLAPFIGANSSFSVTLTEPIVLNQNNGVLVRSGSPGSAITVAFEYIEESL